MLATWKDDLLPFGFHQSRGASTSLRGRCSRWHRNPDAERDRQGRDSSRAIVAPALQSPDERAKIQARSRCPQQRRLVIASNWMPITTTSSGVYQQAN
jgi:hypothetical protein